MASVKKGTVYLQLYHFTCISYNFIGDVLVMTNNKMINPGLFVGILVLLPIIYIHSTLKKKRILAM
jgi:hypothetical protein